MLKQAEKDFNNLQAGDIKTIPIGKFGTLKDVRTAIVRNKSKDGRATLEIQKGKNKLDMKIKENVRKFTPQINIQSNLYLKHLIDNTNTLKIVFCNTQNDDLLHVDFADHITYRNTDEGDRMRFLNQVDKMDEWPIYEVEKSSYISWFCAENYNIHDPNKFKHFLFATQNDFIDVLSISDPHIYID